MNVLQYLTCLLREAVNIIHDPGKEKNSNYSLTDIILSAHAVFRFQSPSWLSRQRKMASEYGSLNLQSLFGNLQSLFGCTESPADNHIRSVFDNIDNK
jgi:hypothetical protein